MSRIIEEFERICIEKSEETSFIYRRSGKLVKKSFLELYNDVYKRSSYLKSIGAEKKERVLVFTPPSYELAVFMLACMKTGISVMYVDIWAGKGLIKDTLDKYKADYIAVSKKTSFLRLGFGGIRSIKKLIFIDKDSRGKTYDLNTCVEEDTLALLTMTSGSTGVPKIALRTHRDLYEQLELVNANMEGKDSQVVLTTAFIYSFANILKGFCTVLGSVNLSLPWDFLLNNKLKKFREVPITAIMTSPDFCLRTKNFYPELKTLYVGGAILNINEARAIERKYKDVDIVYIYGATECNLIAKTKLSSYIKHLQDKKIACLGTKAAGVNIKNSDKNEIMVSSKAVLKEYIFGERKNVYIDEENVFWHKTGDAGRYIDDRLYYLGRFDTFVVKNDKRQHNNPIEQALCIDFEFIKKCAFFYYKEKNRLYIETVKSRGEDKLNIKLRKYLLTKGFDNLSIYNVKKIPCDKKHHTKTDYRRLKAEIKD